MNKYLRIGGIAWMLVASVFVLTACGETEEGCNDALANNFDLATDKPCKNCCEYPGVLIRFTHKFGNTPMVYNQRIFSDAAGNSLGFGDLRFYISEVQLISVGNKVINVQEPLDVYLEKSAGDTVKTTIPNSYGLARGVNQTDIFIQSFRDTATLSKIRFKVGIAGEMNQANPLRLPSDHPLRSSLYDGMYLGAQSGYVFSRVLYYAKETVDLKISSPSNLRSVELPFSRTPVGRGYNVNIQMDVNYQVWFQGVNTSLDSPAQVSQKIVNNLTQAFSVTQVTTTL